MKKKSSVGKFVFGAAVGAGLGLLFAPKNGQETREDLKKKLDEFAQKVKEIDANEVKDSIINKVAEIKTDLKDLDKEDISRIVKEKAKALEKKTEELVQLASDSAKPKIEEMANSIKKSTAKTLKNIVTKLETEDKTKTPKKKTATKKDTVQ